MDESPNSSLRRARVMPTFMRRRSDKKSISPWGVRGQDDGHDAARLALPRIAGAHAEPALPPLVMLPSVAPCAPRHALLRGWQSAGLFAWLACLATFDAGHHALDRARACGHIALLPAEYTTFSPLAYSLDILLPLVDLGQKKPWVRLLNWFEILYGWIASLLFVAIVSGISRRSETEN